jgi:Fe-S cluster biogenesis protein NfuA
VSHPVWQQYGRLGDEAAERIALEKALTEEAPKLLASHKGTVEIESYIDRVLTLALGGGCAGCASANITTQRELAACLYEAVPLLDGIKSAES